MASHFLLFEYILIPGYFPVLQFCSFASAMHNSDIYLYEITKKGKCYLRSGIIVTVLIIRKVYKYLFPVNSMHYIYLYSTALSDNYYGFVSFQ